MTALLAGIIPAAGSGLRFAAMDDAQLPPKALRMLAGSSLVCRAVAALAPAVDEIVVAAPADRLGQVEEVLVDVAVPVAVVPGGATRQQSVRLALDAVASSVDFVLVHDAARPLVPLAVVQRVVSALRAGATAVVPTIRVVDSLRQTLESGLSVCLDRSLVRAVQTPQGFARRVLAQAHEFASSGDAGDDAMLVEQLGVDVVQVAGDDLAFKITRPLDLIVAEAVLAARVQT